jgi:ArsR family transcriptional regulator
MADPKSDACCGTDSGLGLATAQAEELAVVLAALGDPIRLRIYSLIAANDEVCSCDLEGPVAKSQPTISHHTAKLAAAGLIVGEKRGRWMWWRAVPGRLDAITSVISSATQFS